MECRATFSDGSKAQIISHHGIVGMKWGIRRFQDAAGRLTEAGRERYHHAKSGWYTLTSKPARDYYKNRVKNKVMDGLSELSSRYHSMPKVRSRDLINDYYSKKEKVRAQIRRGYESMNRSNIFDYHTKKIYAEMDIMERGMNALTRLLDAEVQVKDLMDWRD